MFEAAISSNFAPAIANTNRTSAIVTLAAYMVRHIVDSQIPRLAMHAR